MVFYPSKPVADAGYGNEENYQFNQEHGIENVQKYSMYDKKKTSSFKKKQFQRLNWNQDSDGFYICPHQSVFNELIRVKKQKTGTGFEQNIWIYKESNRCENCPFKENKECTQAENGRSLHVNWQREQFEREVDERLAQADGWKLKKERKCQVEGTFGILKEDRQFVRFHYRGLEKVSKEFDWQCIGFNVKKYHLSLHRKKKESPESSR